MSQHGGLRASLQPLLAGTDDPKDSPNRGDAEKPATPGEGALSSDLDKIPTEGEGPPPPPHPHSPIGGEKRSEMPPSAIPVAPFSSPRRELWGSSLSFPFTELPKMESKDVQQLFKDVLGSAERGEQPLNCVEGSGAGQDPGRAQRPFLQGELQLPGQGGCTQGAGGGQDSLPPICAQGADALRPEILGFPRSFRN